MEKQGSQGGKGASYVGVGEFLQVLLWIYFYGKAEGHILNKTSAYFLARIRNYGSP